MEELDLKELFNMFWTRITHIIIIVFVFAVIGMFYSFLFVSPVYKSYTTLVLATSSEENNASGETITQTDISLNNNLVATYSEIIKSKSIVREVIKNLNLDKTEDELRSNISVSNVKSTQMIKIEVVDSDSYQAKRIANEVAKIFGEEVKEIYKINNVRILDEAEEETVPYNINHMKDVAIFGFIGIVVSCIYVLIANMLDTTVKGKEDVERKLGLTVLVEIPVCSFDETTKTIAKKGGRR